MAKLQIKSETIATYSEIFQIMEFLGVLVWANSLIRASEREIQHACFYFELYKQIGCGFKVM